MHQGHGAFLVSRRARQESPAEQADVAGSQRATRQSELCCVSYGVILENSLCDFEIKIAKKVHDIIYLIFMGKVFYKKFCANKL